MVVANDREIVFRTPPSDRITTLLIGLACLSPWPVFLWDLAAGGIPADDMPFSSLAFALGVMLAPFALLFLSMTGPNEMRLDLVARTYRLRRYPPFPFGLMALRGAGLPLGVQDTRGPWSDILRLEVKSSAGKASTFYFLHVVWKDPRRARAHLACLASWSKMRAVLNRTAGELGVPGVAD